MSLQTCRIPTAVLSCARMPHRSPLDRYPPSMNGDEWLLSLRGAPYPGTLPQAGRARDPARRVLRRARTLNLMYTRQELTIRSHTAAVTGSYRPDRCFSTFMYHLLVLRAIADYANAVVATPPFMTHSRQCTARSALNQTSLTKSKMSPAYLVLEMVVNASWINATHRSLTVALA